MYHNNNFRKGRAKKVNRKKMEGEKVNKKEHEFTKIFGRKFM